MTSFKVWGDLTSRRTKHRQLRPGQCSKRGGEELPRVRGQGRHPRPGVVAGRSHPVPKARDGSWANTLGSQELNSVHPNLPAAVCVTWLWVEGWVPTGKSRPLPCRLPTLAPKKRVAVKVLALLCQPQLPRAPFALSGKHTFVNCHAWSNVLGFFFDQLGHLLDLSSIHVALRRGKMPESGT